jgi:hypothetical protein
MACADLLSMSTLRDRSPVYLQPVLTVGCSSVMVRSSEDNPKPQQSYTSLTRILAQANYDAQRCHRLDIYTIRKCFGEWHTLLL